METAITISGDLLDRIAKAIPPGSGVTITCQNGLIQYHVADGVAPPSRPQPIDSDAAKLRCEIANALGMEYKSDAHLLSVLGNAALSPNSQDVLGLIFDVLRVPFGQFNNALAAIKALQQAKLDREVKREQLFEIASALGFKEGALFSEVASRAKNHVSDAARAKAHQDILNTRNDELSGELTSLHHSIANALGIEFVSNSANFAVMVRMRNGNTTMGQQILDLQQTLRDLRCGVALKLGVVYEGDAPLIGACAALREENKAAKSQDTISISGNIWRQNLLDEICEIFWIDKSKQWEERLQEIRVIRASGAQAKNELRACERDMEKVCAALGVNSASHVDYIISTIASLKSTSAPPKAQLTYKVHDDGYYWHVSADMMDGKRFKKNHLGNFLGGLSEYKTHLETVLGYKERK